MIKKIIVFIDDKKHDFDVENSQLDRWLFKKTTEILIDSQFGYNEDDSDLKPKRRK